MVDADHRSDAIRGTLAVATATGLWRIAARRILYATGGYDQNLEFLDSDRPGVISARACGRLAFRHGISPGRRIAIVGPSPYGDRLAEGLRSAGVRADRIGTGGDPHGERLLAASGHLTLRGLILADGAGRERRVTADVIAVAAIPAPASELPRQHGIEVTLDPDRGGFAVGSDGEYHTSDHRVFCCGDVTGYIGPDQAAQAGAAAARAVSQTLNP